jgi:hypothetical protein
VRDLAVLFLHLLVTIALARILTVVEAATGFAFLAIVVAYLPVLYQSFSRREAQLASSTRGRARPPRRRKCCGALRRGQSCLCSRAS